MIREWFFGFHDPVMKEPAMWFGHVEVWGFTEDETWMFMDPQGKGTKIVVAHKYEEVSAQIGARLSLCDLILSYKTDKEFSIPVHGIMTCANICGSLVGIRALVPSTLRRRLLAQGAEVIHEAEGRSRRQSRQTAGTPHVGTGPGSFV